MSPTRRDVLKGLALAGASIAGLPGCPSKAMTSPPRNPWPQTPWAGPGVLDTELFPLAAQAGEPSATSLIACTKTLHVGDVLLHTAWFVDGEWQEQVPIAPTRDGDFLRTELTGLPSDTTVAIAFVTQTGRSSRVVHARTTLEEGELGAVRLLLNCCDHTAGAPYYALSNALAIAEVDAHVHLGDAAYCDGSRTVDDFRRAWARHLEHEGYHDLFATAAGIYTWDDHEVTNNWEPSEISPTTLANARQVMHEHLPLPRFEGEPDRLWRSVRFGDVAELFMLDCRGERDRAAGLYISQAQLDWLLDGLSRSTATWKLIGNSVPMTRIPGFDTLPIMRDDNWFGHGEGAQRQQLIDHVIENDIQGVLVLSGDYHMPALGRLEADGPATRIWEVVGGPGGSHPNPAGAMLPITDQVVYADAVRNLIVLDLDSDGTARVQLIDENQVLRLDATLDTQGTLLAIQSRRVSDGP